MKEVSVYDAVGMVLGHDLTQIIPGEYKGSKFKKRACNRRRGHRSVAEHG